MQSKLHNGDAGVKILLKQSCPKLIEQVRTVIDLKDSPKFANNYFGLLRSVSWLELVELSWFED